MTDDPLAATVTATVSFTEAPPAAQSAAVARQVHELRELAELVAHARAGLALPADRRSRLAGGCLELAHEYHAAISALAAASQWAGVYVVGAALLEAFARGAWLARCADAGQLTSFEHAGDGDATRAAALLPEVERALPLVARIRARLGLTGWDADAECAHAGAAHLERRGRAAAGPAYADSELVRALRAAAALGVLAGMELAAVAGQRDLEAVLKRRVEQFAAAVATG